MEDMRPKLMGKFMTERNTISVIKRIFLAIILGASFLIYVGIYSLNKRGVFVYDLQFCILNGIIPADKLSLALPLYDLFTFIAFILGLSLFVAAFGLLKLRGWGISFTFVMLTMSFIFLITQTFTIFESVSGEVPSVAGFFWTIDLGIIYWPGEAFGRLISLLYFAVLTILFFLYLRKLDIEALFTKTKG